MEKFNFKKSMEKVKEKVTFRSVASLCGVDLSGNKHILCPLHSEKTPSFLVYDPDSGEGSYYCFAGCGGGDSISFYSKYHGVSNTEALKTIARHFNIQLVDSDYTDPLVNTLENILHPKEVKKESKIFQYLESAAKANEIFESIKSEDLTPYLIKKQIPHLGTKNIGSTLVIPIYDENENVIGLQYIEADGSKKFLNGSKTFGGMFRLGPENKSFSFLAEGYSTGASVHISTGKTVYVCFSSGNIRNVFNSLKRKYRDIELTVAGDNDVPGRAHGLFGLYPRVEKQDWNDVMVNEGKEVVNKYLSYDSNVKQIPLPEHVKSILREVS